MAALQVPGNQDSELFKTVKNTNHVFAISYGYSSVDCNMHYHCTD